NEQPGRRWRPLQDTADAAQVLYNLGFDGDSWASWRRTVDFYDEGELIWLDADTLIRQQSGGQKSLNDFCQRFHGGNSGSPQVKTYTFDDVIATLNEVQPYDWKAFLNDRLTSTRGQAPLDGITHGGWKLVYNEHRIATTMLAKKPRRSQTSPH